MYLDEFMNRQRDAIVALALQKVGAHGRPVPVELEADLRGFLAEIIETVQRREDGVPPSALGRSAEPIGAHQQRAGAPIDLVAWSLGSISDAMGELAADEGLTFAADEYHAFNRCLDAGTAVALERYWSGAMERIEHADAERLGGLAHELRNALGTARMAFTLLQRGQVGVHSATGRILERNLARMDALIGGTLTGLHSGAPPSLERHGIDLTSFLQDLATSTPVERGIRVEVEAEPDLRISGDEQVLTSAVGNLVQNAVKFTRPDGRVMVRAARRGDRAVIAVEDECGGLLPDDVEALFAPFVQGRESRGGVGLGLSIVRNAARSVEGRVTGQNLPGKGCVFTLDLPLGQAPSPSAAADREARRDPTRAPS